MHYLCSQKLLNIHFRKGVEATATIPIFEVESHIIVNDTLLVSMGLTQLLEKSDTSSSNDNLSFSEIAVHAANVKVSKYFKKIHIL